MITTTAADLGAFLAEIPSETTPRERMYLFNHFSKQWSGSGAVIELGPFLGGTTRAIARGMIENPRLTPGARLHTFDRFGDYYLPERLRETIAPMVANGALSSERADELCRTSDFLRLFEAVHQPHEYYRLIETHSAPLPDWPDEIDGCTALAPLASNDNLTALFIDGCKSWASTRYAMEFLLPRARPDAPLIFQDFGWYTCFWISAFVHALDDFLELQGFVDATYVYRIKGTISAETVARRFAKTPELMGPQFFRQASMALLKRSLANKDVRGGLIAQLHLVAALASIGRKPEAMQLLRGIDPAGYGPLARMIEGSWKSPTYGPGNRPVHWTD